MILLYSGILIFPILTFLCGLNGKTAEQEKALREWGKKVGASELDTYKSTVLGDLGEMTSLDGRCVPIVST